MYEEKQIKDYIENLKSSGKLEEKNFILYEIKKILYQIKEENIVNLILQPQFSYEKMELLRVSYEYDHVTLPILQEMLDAATLETMRNIRKAYLEEKYTVKIEEKEKFLIKPEVIQQEKAVKEEAIDFDFLLKTVELTIVQVEKQLEENRRMTGFLIDNFQEKENRIKQLEERNDKLQEELREKKEAGSYGFMRAEKCETLKENDVPQKVENESVRIEKKTNKNDNKAKKPFEFLKKMFTSSMKKDNLEDTDDKNKLLDIICNPVFDIRQIEEIVEGFESGLDLANVKRYAKESYSAEKMKQIKILLLKINSKQEIKEDAKEMKEDTKEINEDAKEMQEDIIETFLPSEEDEYLEELSFEISE